MFFFFNSFLFISFSFLKNCCFFFYQKGLYNGTWNEGTTDRTRTKTTRLRNAISLLIFSFFFFDKKKKKYYNLNLNLFKKKKSFGALHLKPGGGYIPSLFTYSVLMLKLFFLIFFPLFLSSLFGGGDILLLQVAYMNAAAAGLHIHT